MRYTGIDGGMSGAISILTADYVFLLKDMPLKMGWYDPHEIHKILTMGEQIIGLEESFRFPKLCKGLGILWAIAQLAPQSELVMVLPRTWQKHHGIRKADKNVSIEIARKLFPGRAKELTLKKHHNRAESLLIASWVRSQYLEKNKSAR